jgi:hypothetical protein
MSGVVAWPGCGQVRGDTAEVDGSGWGGMADVRSSPGGGPFGILAGRRQGLGVDGAPAGFDGGSGLRSQMPILDGQGMAE